MHDINGSLTPQGAVQFVELWVAIMEVERDVEVADTFSWPWEASRQYSARSAYHAMNHTLV